jgi:hypothetical protein
MMNKTTILLLAMVSLMAFASAQVRDSAATTPHAKENRHQQAQQERMRHQAKELKGFIDKNANGIDDRLELASKSKKPAGKDKFIDKDGDGICDERATGMGFRRGGAIGPAGEQAGTMERKRKRGGS